MSITQHRVARYGTMSRYHYITLLHSVRRTNTVLDLRLSVCVCLSHSSPISPIASSVCVYRSVSLCSVCYTWRQYSIHICYIFQTVNIPFIIKLITSSKIRQHVYLCHIYEQYHTLHIHSSASLS